MLRSLPNVDGDCIDMPSIERLCATPSTHPPRILLLYGSLRERSYSRFLTQEAERLLNYFGAETRIFDPTDLPLPDGAEVGHPKVQELRDLSLWSEGDKGADRLDSTLGRRGAADAGPHARRHAGVRRLAELQCR
jgi:arsenic resistance protein ArsH